MIGGIASRYWAKTMAFVPPPGGHLPSDYLRQPFKLGVRHPAQPLRLSFHEGPAPVAEESPGGHVLPCPPSQPRQVLREDLAPLGPEELRRVQDLHSLGLVYQRAGG